MRYHPGMLTEYIRAAMHEALYELMEDGRFFAVIPACEGLWSEGATLESAREQLQDVLEDWILIKARHDDVFPTIAGVDINPQPAYAEADEAAGVDPKIPRARVARSGIGQSSYGNAAG